MPFNMNNLKVDNFSLPCCWKIQILISYELNSFEKNLLRPSRENFLWQKHIQKAAHNPENASESLLKHINFGGCFLHPFLHPMKSELWRWKKLWGVFQLWFSVFQCFHKINNFFKLITYSYRTIQAPNFERVLEKENFFNVLPPPPFHPQKSKIEILKYHQYQIYDFFSQRHIMRCFGGVNVTC